MLNLSKKMQKILALVLVCCITLTGFSVSAIAEPVNKVLYSADNQEETNQIKTTTSSAVNLVVTSQAALNLQEANDTQYLIYPIPREITYGSNGFSIGDKVNIIYGNDIDSYTKSHLETAISCLSNPPQLNESLQPVKGKINILVGIKGSGDAADTALKDINTVMNVTSAGISEDLDIFEKDNSANDSYIINVSEDGNIIILGKDTDAAFYGITTLKHIFSQMSKEDTDVIRTFTIRDYASVSYRGFIEGYYGIPWSHENRISLMEWGSEWKMNAYVFAPKDDLYHNLKWRELYPADELVKIEELAETGNRTKNRYVYALHPFMNEGFNFNDFDNDFDIIIKKFEQLYNVGVRQFAILADDAGSYRAEDLSKLLNNLNEWRKKYSDIYPLMFCPDVYNASWVGDGYLKLAQVNQLMNDDIEIFWTGQGVCGHASKAGAQSFVENINNVVNENPDLTKQSRKPLMWLNWPVDDINMRRLIIGPGSNEGGAQYWNDDGIAVLNKDEADYFTGIISNPMQQAQLNKIPLFAVADFAWNDDDYNGQKSWKDSFQFVDQQAGNALHEMAKHLSDPDPNTHKMICGESEDIKELLENFLQDFKSGKSISSQSESLIKEFEKIVNACNTLKELSQNDELLKEIESHRLALKEISQSCIYFIRTAVALEQQKPNDVWANYSKATAELSKSKTHSVKTLDGFVYAESGSKRIIPFANTMAELLEDPVKSMIDPDYVPKAKVKFYRNNLGSWYSGTDADVIDGNSNTFAWTNAEVITGSNFGITYSIPVTITNFQVLTGDAPNNTGDALGKAILEYKSKDDTEYKQVPNGEFTAAGKWDFSDAPLENVVEMKVSSLENTSKWLVIREIGMIQEIETSNIIEGTLFRSQDIVYGSNNEGLYGPDSKAIDGDDSTYVHYGSGSNGNANIPEGAYVGLNFGKPVKFGKVRILQGNGKNNDHMSNAVLEYSLDGNEYKPIQANLNQNEIILDLIENDITAQYIRLRNGSGCETWLALRTFEVLYPEKGTLAYTNSGEYSEMTCEIGYDNASLNVYSGKDITLNPNEYIGIKLPRIRNIISITSSVSGDLTPTLEVGANEYEMKTYDAFNVSESNSINAKYIRLKNNTSSQINFNLTELSVRSNEIYSPSLVESTMGSEYDDTTIKNVFDGNLNNEVILNGLQGKDRYAIIDIGQSVNINSLQLVVEDSEHDWIRYAKIEGSQSAEGPWTHIVNVGKQGANVDTPLISEESGWIHTISYCYSGSNPEDVPLNINARYLKITYLVEEENIDKWTRISEICINSFIKGNDYIPAYMPSENNPTFEGAKEVRGHSASNITDGNIRTTYKPETQEPGYILYRLSENIDKYKMINILQSPASLSEADVLIREAGSSDFIKIGELANSMNEFNISSFKTIAEIKIEWKDKIPELHEFLISDKIPVPIDKTELNELIKKAEELNISGYDEQILNIFNTALKNAKGISENNYVMQSSVEQSARELSEIIAVMMEDLPANKPVSLTDNETKINVKANAGILPEASVLFAKLITKEGLYDVAKAALESISNKFTLYDIMIKANSLVVQPKNGKATISIPVPSSYDTSLIELYEINGSGHLVGIQYKLDNGNIVFDIDHFNNGTAFIIAEKIKEEQPVNKPVSLTDNATKINVKAEAGVLPNESVLSVKSIVAGNLYNTAVNVFKNIYKSFVLYDIIVEADSVAVQPKNGKATVSIPVPSNYNISLLKLYEINEDGNLFDISYILSNGNVIFDTDHFSNKTAFVISEKSTSNGNDNNSGGSSNGGSTSSGGSSSKASKTSNETNKDKKVEVNDKTGETTTTITTKDNIKITKVEAKDGSYTTTAETSDGIKTETICTVEGNITANVTLPSDRDTIKVMIPLNKVTQNTIVKIINSDNTEEIIKKSIPTEYGIMVMLNKSAKLVIVDNSKEFYDIQNHWAADSIAFVSSRMLFQGTSQEEFSPEKPMTRAMIVSVLHRFEGEPESNNLNLFKDVSNDKYYSTAVAWAAENNIVVGMENEFNPDENVTREQLVSILYRYKGSPEINGNIDSFSDKSDVSSWANDAMIWAVESGIISGTDKNTLNPVSSATRAEVSSIFERFIKILFK